MQDQCSRIVAYLKRHSRSGITGLEALTQLGVIHLSSRITDLVSSGHKIRKDWVTVNNRFGEAVRVRRYRLER